MMSFRTDWFSGVAFVFLWLLSASSLFGQSSSSTVSAELPTGRLLNRYGLERAWWSQATINTKRDKITHLVSDEENVYLQGSNGIVTAFDAESGKKLWAVQLGNRDESVYPGVSNDRQFLVVYGMSLYCIERFKGEVLWELKLPTMPSVGPSVDEDHIYIGALDGSMYSFELRKINELYRKRMLPNWSFESLRWRYSTAKEITTPATSTGRLVSFASRSGSLYSVSTVERKLVWQSETDAPISAPFATTHDMLVLASEDFYVYCLNRETGAERWRFASGFPIRKAPRIVGQDLYILPDRGGLFNLSLQSGREKWIRPGITNFLTATKTKLLTSDATGNVVILNRASGAMLGSIPLRPFNVRLENERTDRLYLSTTSGLVMCLREQGSEFATYHRSPERSPLVPEIEPDEQTPPMPMPDGAAANDANQ